MAEGDTVIETRIPGHKPLEVRRKQFGDAWDEKGVKALGRGIWGAAKLLKKGVTRETVISATLIGAALGGGYESGKAYDDFGEFKRDVGDIFNKKKLPLQVEFDRLVDEKKSGKVVDRVIDTHYQGMVGEQRQALKQQVELMSIYMSDRMTVEGFENIAQHSALIEKECGSVGLDPGVIEGMLGAETGGGVLGKLEHKTKEGALGPLGITDGFAQDRGVEITNDENDPRLDWEFSIRFGCQEMSKYVQKFGDVSLAEAAWHRGPEAVGNDLAVWAAANGLKIEGNTAVFVQEHQVNDWKLRQNKEIRESWETEGANETNIYPTRVAGTHLLLENVSVLAGEKQIVAAIDKFYKEKGW